MNRLVFSIILSFFSLNLTSFPSFAADDDYRYPDLEDYQGRGCIDFTKDCGDDHQKPGDLFTDLVHSYPSPAFKEVNGREYKNLVKSKKDSKDMDEVFADLWETVKKKSEGAGYKVTEKAENPMKIEVSTKEYFDTKKQEIWKAGYLIRVSTKIVDGKAQDVVNVTVKSIKENPLKTLSAKLEISKKCDECEGVKVEAQENVSFFPGGDLDSYIEKGISFSVPEKALGNKNLADFGKFVPKLLKIGLPKKTHLVGTKAYATKVTPGAVELKGAGDSGIYFEAWSEKKGEKPFVIDFSFGYDSEDYYGSEKAHVDGEEFMLKVVKGELEDIIAKDSAKWAGSKVRLMMKRPVEAR